MVAKENQSFHKSEFDIQELNWVDMGHILYSTNTCMNMLNHSGDEMRKNLAKKNYVEQ
jgi:hypothetical protein